MLVDEVNYDSHTDALMISWIRNEPKFFKGLTSNIKNSLYSESFLIVFDYVNILWVLEWTSLPWI